MIDNNFKTTLIEKHILTPEILKYEKKVTEENKIDSIIADTKKPEIILSATAVNYDDNKNVIKGNEGSYRKGAVIIITATVNEYVYNRSEGLQLEKFQEDNAPEIGIRFSISGNSIGKPECVGAENKEKETIFTYNYEISNGDNGLLKLNIPGSSVYDIALNSNDITEEKLSKLRELNKIAEERGQSLTQLALAWVLREERVTSALIGASKVSQVEENVGTIRNLSFSEEELKRIDEILK